MEGRAKHKRLTTGGLVLVSAMTFGAQPGDVAINEIAWMGTAAGYQHEWIELYNTTGTAISLAGWTLAAADGTPNIALTGTIPAYGFYLLERTSDVTVSNITADRIYSGDLGNNGEKLQLRDASAKIIDEVNCSSGWFAGENSTKKTMERRHPRCPGNLAASWGNNNGVIRNGLDAQGNPLNGTPKAQNSVYDQSLSVQMVGFQATLEKGGVYLRWKTASEVDTKGFLLSRGPSREGPFEKLRTSLIPARGNDAFGAEYEVFDNDLPPYGEVWYHLEELDAFGGIHSIEKLRVLLRSEQLLPTDHVLQGAYPNPFNPTTTIAYQIGKAEDRGFVSLVVYDLLGRRVKTLVEAVQSPGFSLLVWDGKDDRGTEAPSGLYLVCLSVDGIPIASRRLIKME